MKFSITNKEELKWLIPLIVIVSVYFMGNNIYNYFKVNDINIEEKQDLINFVEEHNNSLKFKIEKNTALSEDISKISFGVDENQSEEESEILKPLEIEKKVSFENREIKSYTESLPEMPDEEISKEMFVDENDNGVRDDVEIPIVKEFGSDRDLVEAFFAKARISERKIFLAENDMLDYDSIQDFNKLDGANYDCSFNIFTNSSFSEKNFDDDLYRHSEYTKSLLGKKYLNTKKRKSLYQEFENDSTGTSLPVGVTDSFEQCKDFFKKTKSWNFN